MEIFFNKFSETKDDKRWQYELCLTQNMERLHYQSPDFQNEVIDFAFDAYIDNGKNDMSSLKRTIVRRLVYLLSKNDHEHYFYISRSFDKKLAGIKSDPLILKAVRSFSFDVLNEILSAYDNIPKHNNYFCFEIFPTDKWNISTLLDPKNEKSNAKAMGLFISYLEALPMFVGSISDKIDDRRVTFLDEIVFGMSSQKFSRQMIRAINLYFSQNFFTSYEAEDIGHALIRNFIDNDYHFLFMDTPCSVSSSFDPNEPEEQRLKRVMAKFKEEEDQRDKDTIKLLSKVYKVLLDVEKVEAINAAIADYDLKDKAYQYRTSVKILESNLENLRSTINKIIKYESGT